VGHVRRFESPGEGNDGEAIAPSSTGRSPTMLWTILIILVIIALALFIFSRMRGGRRL
jgi:hypothetical protein